MHGRGSLAPRPCEAAAVSCRRVRLLGGSPRARAGPRRLMRTRRMSRERMRSQHRHARATPVCRRRSRAIGVSDVGPTTIVVERSAPRCMIHAVLVAAAKSRETCCASSRSADAKVQSGCLGASSRQPRRYLNALCARRECLPKYLHTMRQRRRCGAADLPAAMRSRSASPRHAPARRARCARGAPARARSRRCLSMNLCACSGRRVTRAPPSRMASARPVG